jgi:hypothetical protein
LSRDRDLHRQPPKGMNPAKFPLEQATRFKADVTEGAMSVGALQADAPWN